MGNRFAGQCAFITGASSGIGAEIARQLAADGANVVLAARRAERLADVEAEIKANGGQALSVSCDVCDRASIDAAMDAAREAFGGIDLVLANAGFGVSGPFQRLNTEDFQRQFDTNVFGAIDTVYAALPDIIERKGRIGLVSSIMGHFSAPAFSAYCSSKFAVRSLAECMYYDLADSGVSVTCIAPGIVASEIRKVNNQGELVGKRDPVPDWLIMPTDTAARQIINALYKRKPDVTITFHGKLILFLHSHFPRFFRFVMRQSSKGKVNKMHEARRDKDAGQ